MNRFGATVLLVSLLALSGIAALAQQADEESADESEDVEEIIVVAPKPGSRKQVDQEYEDPARAKLLQDLYKLEVDEEEYEWRMAAAVDSPSRIKWGYDPRDDYQMRSSLDLHETHGNDTKPATLFRLEF